MKFNAFEMSYVFLLSIILGMIIGISIAPHTTATHKAQLYITATESYIEGFETGVKWQQSIEEHNRLMEK